MLLRWVSIALGLVAFLGPALLERIRPEFKVIRPQGAAVVVTGVSSGIGKSAAVALIRAGYTVFGTVRKERDADGVRDALSSQNKQVERNKKDGKAERRATDNTTSARFSPIVMDVTNEEEINRASALIDNVLAERGLVLAGLVNNAGTSDAQILEAVDMKQARWLFDVNVFGLVQVTQAFLPLLRSSQGRIVNIGSLAGKVVRPMGGVYSASKFAVEAVTDALRRELRESGVSVSLVQPGVVASEMANRAADVTSKIRRELSAKKLDAIEGYRSLVDKREKSRHNYQNAPLPESTTDGAILDALQSPRPKSRYPVAGFGRIPGWLIAILPGLLPDSILDIILEQ